MCSSIMHTNKYFNVNSQYITFKVYTCAISLYVPVMYNSMF